MSDYSVFRLIKQEKQQVLEPQDPLLEVAHSYIKVDRCDNCIPIYT